MMRGKSSARLTLIIAIAIAVLTVLVFAPSFAHGATFSGMCSATNGYVVGKQCRWPLRISQATTRRACRTMGGVFFLAQKYQGCAR